MEKTTRIIRLKANAPELSIAQGVTKIVVPTDGDRHKRVYHSSVATLPALREKATVTTKKSIDKRELAGIL
jgi:hypothetical protein